MLIRAVLALGVTAAATAAAVGGVMLASDVAFGEEAEVDAESVFGEPTVRGTGCPEGTFTFTATPTAFTFLFDSFSVNAGDGAKWQEMYKTCTMKIPVEVPAGFQLSVDSVDYRGFATLDKGAHGYLKSWYILRGQGTHQLVSARTTEFKGPLDEDFFRRDAAKKPVWTRCGGTHTLTVNAYMLTTARRGARSFIQIDSNDGAASLRAGLAWKRCK